MDRDLEKFNFMKYELDWQMSTDTYMTIHTALCLSHCAIKLKMYAEPN